jgi:serine/threonine protein kinase/tetratricopeptide (TPR) repeat protein
VADMLERLAAALADSYALERELGSGGMATVYLAQDLKHERQVAVKVLRPELAAALGPERFHQEIKIAANLNHPHVLPLLDSGDADGFLYYVMPYVEGQSLRDKLAHEGELPIPEAVRILRDVVDALSEAHEKGVVHRDIKPDNVLLIKHHALVTDFGVAKAVSEATGAQKLTTEGVALGTPAYMSPEQAAADRHIDHRADIYAVGALAYELLTGRPPFTGTTPQEVLSAQVTQAPEPVTKHRATVPSALESVVMRCLEKRPADRWQSAEELLPQLEALATPSGGITPIGTAPIEGRVKSTLRRRIGIWAVAAVMVAAIVVVGISLVGDGNVVPSQPSVAVLPFEHIGSPNDAFFTEGIADEITIQLAGDSGLRVIARASTRPYAGSAKTISTIAEELGVDYVLAGTVRWEGAGGDRRVRVSPQLLRGSDETHVWAESYEAALTGVFEVQRTISEQVADELSIALVRRGTDAHADLPTTNVLAFEECIRGRAAVVTRSDEGIRRAIDHFRAAIELDSLYAEAWAGLADALALVPAYIDGQWAEWLPRADSAARRALAINPRLGEAHASAALVRLYNFDFEAARELLDRAVELSPNYPQAHNLRAVTAVALGDVSQARGSIERLLALDPRSVASNHNSGRHLQALGDYEAAIRAYELAHELDPSRSYDLDCGLIYRQIGQITLSDSLLTTWAESQPRPEWRRLVGVLSSPSEAREILTTLGATGPNWSVAVFYAVIGDESNALDHLERLYESRSVDFTDLLMPEFYAMRDNPRYRRFMADLGMTILEP